MKFTNKLLVAAMVAMMGVVAVAQDRKYERSVPLINVPPGQRSTVEYHFTDSEGEVGFRYITSYPRPTPCNDGFIKLVKSVELGATLYTTVDLIRTCPLRRFVFPNGDLSSGYVQGELSEGVFAPVLEKMAEWESKGIKPSLILKN